MNNELGMIELTDELLEEVVGGRMSDNVKMPVSNGKATHSVREEAFGIPRGGKIHVRCEEAFGIPGGGRIRIG